jgi:hypothetical protein
MDSPSYSSSVFLMTLRSASLELSVLPAQRTKPRMKSFRTDSHPQALREIMEQAAEYFFRCPTLAGAGKNMMSQRVISYPSGLVGTLLPAGVTSLAKIPSPGGAIATRPPNPYTDFPRNRRTVTTPAATDAGKYPLSRSFSISILSDKVTSRQRVDKEAQPVFGNEAGCVPGSGVISRFSSVGSSM